MKFEIVRKQANFWHVRSIACSQFVHIYFPLFLEKFAYFCETTAKSRLAPAGSVGQLGLREPRLAFFCAFCVFRGSHPISRKMTNHGMHGIHGKINM